MNFLCITVGMVLQVRQQHRHIWPDIEKYE